MEYLKYFITEEIYLLPDRRNSPSVSNPAPEVKKDQTPPTPEKKTVSGKYPACILSAELSEDEQKLLKAILNAVKLGTGEVQHITSYEDISSDMVIIFGDLPEVKDQPRYRVVAKDNRKVLIADKLSTIHQDTEKKKLLWAALKQMFNV